MNYFYADSRNQPVGPVTISELQRMVSMGTLTATSWVIPQGETQWQPLSSVIPVSTPPPLPDAAAYPNPYAAPAGPISAGPYGSTGNQAAMPGLKRLGYFLVMLGLVILYYVVLVAFMTPHVAELLKGRDPNSLTEAEAMEVLSKIGTPAMLGGITLMVAMLFPMASRLRNIGWSPWLCLISFVPLINIWIGGCCLILPPGYVHTRKMDGASIVLLVLMILGLVAGAVSMTEAMHQMERR